jgi:predicted signal transduction protein with EAL and GGDEF domain
VVRVGASVGIALAHAQILTPHELLREADSAMYRAKEHGRGRCELFGSDTHTTAPPPPTMNGSREGR